METVPISVDRKTLGEKIYEKLRDAIITLKLEPGQMVYENELSESLGVSRTPIREALRLLLSERLIEVLPQRGNRISFISLKTVEEARFVRASLESSAFRLVAEQWTDDEPHRKAKRQLDQLIEEQKKAQAEGNLPGFLQADEAFHRIILELSGNRTLLGVVFQMRGHLIRLRYLALQEVSEMSALVAEHERMVGLLEAREALQVVQLIEHHLEKLKAELPAIRDKFPHYFTD